MLVYNYVLPSTKVRLRGGITLQQELCLLEEKPTRGGGGGACYICHNARGLFLSGPVSLKTPPYDPILSLQTRQQHILAITLDPGGEWLACSCLDGGLYLVPIISLTLVSHLINPRLRVCVARVIVLGVCVSVCRSVCRSVCPSVHRFSW